ncbi:type II restriction endonuclease [Lactococcus protaetiae]|uniref:type II restriction endonuclease n=1 Tax=Lactococcus protaetiae TaxID=2592653 RepID=UPI001CC1FFAC|nr:type II restriction endonuclease [Lactococcus protaetiae]
MFILVKLSSEDYEAYILSTEEEIDSFLNRFNISVTETGKLIEEKNNYIGEPNYLETLFIEYINKLIVDFPSSKEISSSTRRILEKLPDFQNQVISNPDKQLLTWYGEEYKLFRMIEVQRYKSILTGFDTVESFVNVANSVLNRRKSRAGKSLENHTAAIFSGNHLKFEEQVKTEGNRKPDFIFPDGKAYHNSQFQVGKLTFLGAKTTCKDRWRQILNEAERIPNKHLLTLQQGISPQQLDEMAEENVTLVVPQEYIKFYPVDYRERIWNVKKFIDFVKNKEI